MTTDFSGLKARWAAERAGRKRLTAEIREKVLALCPPVFQRYGVCRATLYGSLVDGLATERSDVDLLVEPLDNLHYWDLLHDLEEALDRPVDLYTGRDDPGWVQKIRERGEVIYEAQH